MIKLPDFILIPYQLLEDKDISLVDERLYGVIYWLTKLKNEKCTASNTTLAEVVKTSSGMIRNSLMKLDQKGYIQRTFKDSKKKIRLEIIPLVVFAKVSAVNDNVSLGSDKVSSQSDTRVSLGSEQNKNTYNKNNKEDTSKTSFAEIQTLIDLFKSVNPSYKQFFGNKTERACLSRMLQEHGREKLTELIEVLPKTNSMDFAPVITSPYKLEKKLGDLLAFISKEKIKPQRIIKL